MPHVNEETTAAAPATEEAAAPLASTAAPVTEDQPAAATDAAAAPAATLDPPPPPPPAPVVHPPEVAASIRTAVDIASEDQVNLRTAAEYLHGAHPGYFTSLEEAEKAVQDCRTAPRRSDAARGYDRSIIAMRDLDHGRR